MPSIIAAAPPRGDHDDGAMPGRPTAAPAAHLGGRTVATKKFTLKPRTNQPSRRTGTRAGSGGPPTRAPPPPS